MMASIVVIFSMSSELGPACGELFELLGLASKREPLAGVAG